MCDDAENLAGAGTDVRRCADALGPRKNLHRRVCLIGVYLIGVYLTGLHIIGVHLIDAYFIPDLPPYKQWCGDRFVEIPSRKIRVFVTQISTNRSTHHNL
jgi:hypothetical protein